MEPNRHEDDPQPRPARDDRAAVVDGIIDRLPARVDAALAGDREALIGLLLIAAEFTWQTRADSRGTVEEVAGATQRFVDAVADCYSADRPPSDRMCDAGFALADRVDALAVEVLHLRARAGIDDDLAIPEPRRSPTREIRHLARAHVAALRAASNAERTVTDADVRAAADLYQGIVTLGRECVQQEALATLSDASVYREAASGDEAT